MAAGVRPTDNGKGILIRNFKRRRTITQTLKIPPTASNLEYASKIRDARQRVLDMGMDPFLVVEVDGEIDNTGDALVRMFRQARKRRHGYHLTQADETYLIRRARGACEMTGIPFSMNRYGGKKAPFCPSLDRIDARKPYEVTNVRIVCTAANFAMNEWGESALKAISLGYVQKCALSVCDH